MKRNAEQGVGLFMKTTQDGSRCIPKDRRQKQRWSYVIRKHMTEKGIQCKDRSNARPENVKIENSNRIIKWKTINVSYTYTVLFILTPSVVSE